MKKKSTGLYKVLSLFSGCGGLDLGFAQLGAESFDLQKISNGKRKTKGTRFEIVWSNDVFEPSGRTYSANFDAIIYTNPEEPYNGKHRIFQGDIAKILFNDAVDKEKIDVVIGGPPCQDFSLIRGANKRLGIKVKRGRLYCHFVRALASLQPKMFVVENVKGLISANKGLAYKQILGDFKNLNVRWSEIEVESKNQSFRKEDLYSDKLEGYELLFSNVINFSYLGVPQGRERLIIIGLRKDFLQNFSSLEDVKLKLEKNLNAIGGEFSRFPLTPIETFNGETLNHLQEEYSHVMSEFIENIKEIESKRKHIFMKKVWPNYTMDIWKDYLWINQNNNGNIRLTEWMGDRELLNSLHKNLLIKLGYYRRPLEIIGEFEDNSDRIQKEIQRIKERMKNIPPGENHEFVRDTEHHVTGLMSNIYKRIHPLKPSPTIIAKGGGGTWGYHYKKTRQRLTNRERARLQTFPDSFIFHGTPSQIRTQIGEAVPPLASHTIAQLMFGILDEIN